MYRLIIISLLILQSLIFSQRSQQDFQKELDAQSSAIQSLKDEIKATQKRIQSENRKEKSSVRRVSNLSEEISLLQQLLKEIKKEEKLMVADISRSEKKFSRTTMCILVIGSEQCAKKTLQLMAEFTWST